MSNGCLVQDKKYRLQEGSVTTVRSAGSSTARPSLGVHRTMIELSDKQVSGHVRRL